MNNQKGQPYNTGVIRNLLECVGSICRNTGAKEWLCVLVSKNKPQH